MLVSKYIDEAWAFQIESVLLLAPAITFERPALTILTPGVRLAREPPVSEDVMYTDDEIVGLFASSPNLGIVLCCTQFLPRGRH